MGWFNWNKEGRLDKRESRADFMCASYLRAAASIMRGEGRLKRKEAGRGNLAQYEHAAQRKEVWFLKELALAMRAYVAHLRYEMLEKHGRDIRAEKAVKAFRGTLETELGTLLNEIAAARQFVARE